MFRASLRTLASGANPASGPTTPAHVGMGGLCAMRKQLQRHAGGGASSAPSTPARPAAAPRSAGETIAAELPPRATPAKTAVQAAAAAAAAAQRASTPPPTFARPSTSTPGAKVDSSPRSGATTPPPQFVRETGKDQQLPKSTGPTGRPAAAAVSAGANSKAVKQPPPRNRILMLCTALGENDTPQWPFWKWQHIRGTRGVTDFAMLAVTREESFIATIQNGVASIRMLRRGLKTVHKALLRSFLDEYYVPNSYFVYGGHGVSDLLEFDVDHRMQVHELAQCFGQRTFRGILFDACLMASLDTAYHLRHNAPFIGASEGYMWEEDTWAENHMFNAYSAALMCRDGNGGRVLRLIGEEYTARSTMADYTLIDTSKAEPLWDRVHERHLADLHAAVRLKRTVKTGKEPVNIDMESDFDVDLLPKRVGLNKKLHVHPPVFPPEKTVAGFEVPRSWAYRANYVNPNALYPEESNDDHIIDLGAAVGHDAVTLGMIDDVIAWRANPDNDSLYSVDMHGLNLSLSQYSYQAMRKAMPLPEAEILAAKFAAAAANAYGEPVPIEAALPPVVRADANNNAADDDEEAPAVVASAIVSPLLHGAAPVVPPTTANVSASATAQHNAAAGTAAAVGAANAPLSSAALMQSQHHHAATGKRPVASASVAATAAAAAAAPSSPRGNHDSGSGRGVATGTRRS